MNLLDRTKPNPQTSHAIRSFIKQKNGKTFDRNSQSSEETYLLGVIHAGKTTTTLTGVAAPLGDILDLVVRTVGQGAGVGVGCHCGIPLGYLEKMN